MTIFEQIINREIPAYIIYEDDLVISFLDISQVTKGHTLVVTKKVYKDIFEIPEETLKHLIAVTKHISEAINKALKPEGINLLNNNGETAGQEVMHYHMHIIPRYQKNDVIFKFTNNIDSTKKEEYEKRANVIRAAL
ncbi:HIT family protein [Haploplasma axanthum]|uniref:Histidine triad (HIT) protein n=1 Tax=Haploplasma axanthum TaxID=29552 RepID=A0A449BBF1_HAPAX|nr:HIT family protein [Haploplasma axanthum]VEU79731.1 histidine triad (HIT) protein [Haploplasma axanthum]